MDDDDDGPFHEGERAVQRRAGEAAMARKVAGMIDDEVAPPARDFLAAQGLLAAATLDAEGRPHASVLLGPPGFARALDGRRVSLAVRQVTVAAADPLWTHLLPGAAVGLLAIDLATRRRLRVNGTVAAAGPDDVTIAVREAYPNCPKYIQRRTAAPAGAAAIAPAAQGAGLDAARRALIARSDTFFVASAHPVRGADASHRGGPPGFVQVVDDRTLRIPDYGGNGMFNTLGNLAVAPAVGLAFLDFQHRRVLQVTGTAAVRFDVGAAAGPTGGTGRAWEVHVTGFVESSIAVDRGWQLLDASPHLPTG